MEIGLRAKIVPQLDERETKREASKLQGFIDDAIEGLAVVLEFDDVWDKLEMTQEITQDISADFGKEFTPATKFIPPPDVQDPQKMPGAEAQEATQRQTQAQTEQIIRSVSYMGGTFRLMNRLYRITSMGFSAVRGQLAQMTEAQTALGKMFKVGAASLIITGVALVALMGMWRYLRRIGQHAPILGAFFDMFGLAMSLFFRPFGDALGSALLPMAQGMLQLASEFNQVFGQEGLRSALSWMVWTLISALTATVLNMELEDWARIAAVLLGLAWLWRTFPAILGRLFSNLIRGLGGVFQRILARFGIQFSGTIAQAIGRVLTGLLTRIGLGRLIPILMRFGAVGIPGIGKILTALLLLDMAIDLLFGWSPIFDTILPGIMDILRWIWGGIQTMVKWLVWPFQDLRRFLLLAFSPMLPFLLLGLEVWDLLIRGWNMFMDFLADPMGALGDLFDGAMDIVDVVWDDYIVGVVWDEWMVDLAWETFIVGLLWETFVVGLLWDDFVVGLLWETWIKGLVWDTFVVDLLWGTWVKGLVWGTFIPGARTVADFFGNFIPSETTVRNFFGNFIPAATTVRRFFGNFIPGSPNIRTFFGNFIPGSGVVRTFFGNFIPRADSIRAFFGNFIPGSGTGVSTFFSNFVPGSGEGVRSFFGNFIPRLDWSEFVSGLDPRGSRLDPRGSRLDPRGSLIDPREWYARGGVVSGPTNAVVGEAGPEAIIPFGKIPDFVTALVTGKTAAGIIPGGSAIGPLSAFRTGGVVSGGGGFSWNVDIGRDSTAIEVDINLSDIGQDTIDPRDIAEEIANAVSGYFSDIESSVDNLAKQIRRGEFVESITVEADGKVIAEISDDGFDKYRRRRTIT